MAKGIAGSWTARYRQRPIAGTVEVASWDAALQTAGKWLVGDPDWFANESHGARPAVRVPWPSGGIARIYQENTQNSGWGFGDCAKAKEGVGAMSRKHMGSSIDDFLKEEGIFEEAQVQAVKEVVAWQLAEAMKEKKISKNRMAQLLKTSRTQVDRLLDAKNDITLSSLQRAAAIVGRRLTIELIWFSDFL
jgi:antitoxin HicB